MGYLRRRPLPFYPWLRQFAWERLLKLHRHHIHTRKRSVDREQQWALPLPDGSVMELARRLVASTVRRERLSVRKSSHYKRRERNNYGNRREPDDERTSPCEPR